MNRDRSIVMKYSVRVIILTIVILSFTAAVAHPSNAETRTPSFTASGPSTVDTLVTLTAIDYAPDSTISIMLVTSFSGSSTVCTGATDTSGSFSCIFTVPPMPCGSSLYLTGTDGAGDPGRSEARDLPDGSSSPGSLIV